VDSDESAEDWRDSQDLYRLLEEEIVPAYYERDANGLPQRWLAVMRRAMATALWEFSTTRMLHEYTESLYLPAAGVQTVEAVVPRLVTEAG
jgi:starch phosphorylase